jgi:CPA1 family monovalent cation:H+ antiporter
MEQLREELVDIEADTYAEYIRAGRLNRNLSPVLQGVLDQAIEKVMTEDEV